VTGSRWLAVWLAVLVRPFVPGPSGPVVATLFHRLFAGVLLLAWLSLAVQIRLLIGRQGLQPLAELLASARAQGGLSWLEFPSLLRWPALASDGVLLGGALLGAALAVAALLGFFSRLAVFLSTALYLSYATACQSFLGFQWDNLLIECGLLTAFLPRDRASPAVHLLLRMVLFKLYFESGLAKWQSHLGDWQDGSAMTFYYETAPLPTWLGFYVHHLPAWWHHVESQLTLALELVFPFAIFASRRPRLFVAAAFTLFQIFNAATANYGFFCYLAIALHLFLLEDDDVLRARDALLGRLPASLAARLRRPSAPAPAPPGRPAAPGKDALWIRRLRRAVGASGVVIWLAISLLEGLEQFGPWPNGSRALRPLARLYAPWRVVNTYHLFASVTRERVEPQIEINAGEGWGEQDLRYKPGDPGRAPPFVAPHQPRVDFLLWFHGLSWQHPPRYLQVLVDRVCHRPGAVQSLFSDALPARPQAVRVVYYRYRFATLGERRAARLYWRRELVGRTGEVSCTPQL
jgi:lipase maturation factor 1